MDIIRSTYKVTNSYVDVGGSPHIGCIQFTNSLGSIDIGTNILSNPGTDTFASITHAINVGGSLQRGAHDPNGIEIIVSSRDDADNVKDNIQNLINKYTGDYRRIHVLFATHMLYARLCKSAYACDSDNDVEWVLTNKPNAMAFFNGQLICVRNSSIDYLLYNMIMGMLLHDIVHDKQDSDDNCVESAELIKDNLPHIAGNNVCLASAVAALHESHIYTDRSNSKVDDETGIYESLVPYYKAAVGACTSLGLTLNLTDFIALLRICDFGSRLTRGGIESSRCIGNVFAVKQKVPHQNRKLLSKFTDVEYNTVFSNTFTEY